MNRARPDGGGPPRWVRSLTMRRVVRGTPVSEKRTGQQDQPTIVGRPVGARPMVPPEVAQAAPADDRTRAVAAPAQPTTQVPPVDRATRVVDRVAAGTPVTGAQAPADDRTHVSAARQAARPQTDAATPDTPYGQEDAPGLLGDLSVPQIVAGALAAVTSMLLSNQIGIAGSVIGVAVGSVVSTVASSLYKRALAKGADKLKEKILTPEEQAAADAAAAAGTADAATDPGSVDARVAPASLRAKVHARDAKALQKRVGIGVIAVAVVSALAGVWFTAGFVSLATGGQGLGAKTSIISTAENREGEALDQEAGNGDAVVPGTTDGDTTADPGQDAQKPSTDASTGTDASGQDGTSTGNTGGTSGSGTDTGTTGSGSTGTGDGTTSGTTGDGTATGTEGAGSGTQGGSGASGTTDGTSGTSDGTTGSTAQQGTSGTARSADGSGQGGSGGAATGSTSGN